MERKYPNEEEILKMAKNFRKDSNHKCQYLYSSDVMTDNIDYQDLSQGGKAWTLYNNMLILGLSDVIWVYEYLICGFRRKKSKTAKYIRSQTHHIIPKNLIGDCRIHFDLQSIIDDGRNGIILPTTTNCEHNFANGTPHGNHSKQYEAQIISKINQIKDKNDIWSILDDIKEELYNGTLLLNM